MVAGRRCWTVAAIVVAFLVIAADIADAIGNKASGTPFVTPLVLRWTPRVVMSRGVHVLIGRRPINTLAVVEITTLVVAPEVTFTFVQIVLVALSHITALRKIAAVAAIPIAFFVEAVLVALAVAPIN
jgi:hypothetical protein